MNDIKLTQATPNASVSGTTNPSTTTAGADFEKLLKNSIEEVNTLQNQGEKALADVATGQIKDLHQAAIAIGRAESSMKVMLEVRNKAVSAYKEILRTQF